MSSNNTPKSEDVVPTILVHKSYVDSLTGIFKSGKHSDLIVKCQEETWKVHRGIVCARSTFFDRACNGKWKEAETGIVDIKDENCAVIREMLLFIYSSDYCAPPLETNPARFHVQVYAAAKKFGVPDLRKLAIDKFATAMGSRGKDFDVPAIVEEVYSASDGSDHALRKSLLNLIQPQLLQLVDDPDFCFLLQSVEELAADILRAQLDAKETYCAHCNMVRDMIKRGAGCGRSETMKTWAK